MGIAILAVLCGADGWLAIEEYGKAKYKWLKTFLELPNGIPSHDTFSRGVLQYAPTYFCMRIFHQLYWPNPFDF